MKISPTAHVLLVAACAASGYAGYWHFGAPKLRGSRRRGFRCRQTLQHFRRQIRPRRFGHHRWRHPRQPPQRPRRARCRPARLVGEKFERQRLRGFGEAVASRQRRAPPRHRPRSRVEFLGQVRPARPARGASASWKSPHPLRANPAWMSPSKPGRPKIPPPRFNGSRTIPAPLPPPPIKLDITPRSPALPPARSEGSF